MPTITPPEAAAKPRRRGPIRRLLSNQAGNTAMVFALVLTPVAILSMGSIDFYRANSARANLQDALDSAALVAARAPTSDATQLQNIGMAALQAGLQPRGGETLSTNTNETRFRLINGRIVADGRIGVTPWVSGLFLQNGMAVTAHSEVLRGLRRVEVAMVLDVTGSMNESSNGVSKISRLRDAATRMVNELEAAATASGDSNSVRISLVPFSSTVNVGSANRNATWLVQATGARGDPSNQYFCNTSGNCGSAQGTSGQQVANRFTLFTNTNTTWRGCVESRVAPFDVTDTAAATSNVQSLYVPYFAPDEPGGGDGLSQTDQNNGFFYVNDYLPDNNGSNTNMRYRQGNVGKYNRSPTVSGNSYLGAGYDYGPNFGCLSSTIQPLTTNFATLRNAISNLTASGDTNIPLGLVWGWNTVSPNGPFANNRGVAYSDQDTQKIIVLMTDGNNTNLDIADQYNFNESIYSGLGYIWQNRFGVGAGSSASQRTTQMNSRLTTLCNNLRTQGVQVYTVRVEVTDGDSSVLQNCATEPNMYYDVTDAARLSDVFSSIAGAISRMRIAR